ncbi:MAG: hypothetical protein HY089_13040 [Ignavibacteriales bacterium]|nr:hypothetical protein [Ignavibacteriales bacterium]
MEPKQEMKKSVKILLRDVSHISAIISSVQKELKQVEPLLHVESKLLSMKEELNEVHARLEGIRDFILSCEQRALKPKPETEDIDVWL